MNIIDTLIRLRDDLKEWVTNNIIALNEKFATKSELNNLENRIEELENIIENGGYIPPAGPLNLFDVGELYLNQRFTSSSSSIVSAVGMFALIVPFEGDGKKHTLKFRNLKTKFGQPGSTLYTLDVNKTNPVIINGAAEFRNMTSGITMSDGNLSADVEFVVPTSAKYIAISFKVHDDGTSIEKGYLDGYIITLE